VYLRGDNGTKVDNGFFSDTITATGNSVLPTITTNGLTAPVGSNLAFFATSQNIQFNSATVGFNAHIPGPLSVSTLTDVATINGVAFPQPSGAGVWASTATTALNMAGFNISNAGTISSLNVYGNTAVIGTPSAFGNTFAYFGNNSLASNGGEYALLQENNGQTFLNAKLYQRLFLRNGNYDIMTLDDTQIQAFKPLNMNSNDITNVRTLEALSTQQIAIQQTAGSDFVLFNNGDTRMNAKQDAYVGGDRDVYITSVRNNWIRTPSTNYITIQHTGAGNQSYIQFEPNGRLVGNARLDVELIANAGTGSIALTATITEVRGNMRFTGGNRFIDTLGHIYGDTTAPGDGLAIDYMYGMFFNSPGKNANLYIDAGNLNMINYNTGINIGNYNAFGTGNMNITSQNNDVYIGAPTRGIYLNATNSCVMNSGGAQIAIAGDNNIYFTGNGGGGTTRYANFQDTNVAFNTGTPGSLLMNMNGNRIIRVGDLNRLLGTADVRTPVIQDGIVTTSGGSGSIVVNIPNAYTSATSYIALVSMEDATPAEMSVVRISASQIEIYWANGGGGAHTIAWSCQGE
jgi:hypothetical protein